MASSTAIFMTLLLGSCIGFAVLSAIGAVQASDDISAAEVRVVGPSISFAAGLLVIAVTFLGRWLSMGDDKELLEFVERLLEAKPSNESKA